MEAHPIPQNVTSFEFRLIGDMTLKQFGYLAIGMSTAYLIFIFFAFNYPYVSWPLIIIFAGLGFAFAFVPIGSRPLDHWLKAFLKAIYSPTKRTWRKEGKNFQEDPLFKSRLLMFLPSLSPQPQPVQPILPVSVPVMQPQQSLPTTEELDKTVELARQAQTLQIKIIQTERQLNQLRIQTTQPQQQTINYSQQANIILTDLQKLLGQASEIKQQLSKLEQPAAQPAEPQAKIKVVLPSKPKQTQVALTTFPNIINGIIKNSQGGYLDGAVVVIYDKEGMPVRALKTNKLGQFSGSTPLPNGTYTIETEKEGSNFDVLQIELEGQVLPPLAITAK